MSGHAAFHDALLDFCSGNRYGKMQAAPLERVAEIALAVRVRSLSAALLPTTVPLSGCWTVEVGEEIFNNSDSNSRRPIFDPRRS